MKGPRRKRAGEPHLLQLDLFAAGAAGGERLGGQLIAEALRSELPADDATSLRPAPAIDQAQPERPVTERTIARSDETGDKAQRQPKSRRRGGRRALPVAATKAPPPFPAQHLAPEDAAAMLAVSVKTLETWRRLGRGPRFVKLGRAVRYAVDDLDAFLRSRAVSNSAEGRRLDART